MKVNARPPATATRARPGGGGRVGQGDRTGGQGRRRPGQGHHRGQVDPVGHRRGQGRQRRPPPRPGRSATGTRPRWRSRHTRRSSRRRAPSTGTPRGASASRSSTSWPSDATRLSTTPPMRTVGSRVAKPCTTAATDDDCDGGVDHQHDGGVEGAGDVGGRRGRPVGRPVEQPHDPLDHQQVGAGRGPGGQGADGVEAAQPGVEVAGRASAGEGVVAGIDEVGADLGRRRPVPGGPQGGQQAGGHRGLARPGMGARHHQSGSDHGCSVASVIHGNPVRIRGGPATVSEPGNGS